MQLGYHATQRLYETADGWLCVAATRPTSSAAALQRRRSASTVVADATVRRAALEPAFRTRSATQWFASLDAAGVPCEVSSPDFVLDLFDDPEMIDKGWVTRYRHPIVGDTDVFGLLFDFDETPGVVQGPPLVPGQDTRAILQELGYDDARIDRACGGRRPILDWAAGGADGGGGVA